VLGKRRKKPHLLGYGLPGRRMEGVRSRFPTPALTGSGSKGFHRWERPFSAVLRKIDAPGLADLSSRELPQLANNFHKLKENARQVNDNKREWALHGSVYMIDSFRPERVLFRPGGVNLRDCLCGVPMYASAQSLDFLARTKNPSFPIRKLPVPYPDTFRFTSRSWTVAPP